jgi:glycerophosphoryl diester phosphodiesterase
MRVIGHRGAGGAWPENTLAAIRHAIDSGVDAVEIDVRQLDGALIVLHDETLDRTTSGHGHYKHTTHAALRALDAGQGERVPLLDEVVTLVSARCGLNVEVKEAGIARAVLACLERTVSPTWQPRILLSSFDHATTAALAARRGAMALGVLYEEPFDTALARAVALRARSLNMPVAGLEALVYTVNTVDQFERCRTAGVDAIFTDHPAAMRGRGGDA